jgi:hypothetical protein
MLPPLGHVATLSDDDKLLLIIDMDVWLGCCVFGLQHPTEFGINNRHPGAESPSLFGGS